MTCKTHIATGTMISTLILFPTNLKFLAITLTASTIGSIISDIDVSTSESHKDLDKICAITFISIIVCIGIELYFNIGLFNLINKHTNFSKTLGGMILFLIICFYGMHKPHRTFMHSILCFLILTSIVYTILDIVAIPFGIGFISHIILDLFNKKSIKLFYPLKSKIKFNLCSSNGKVNDAICIISTMLLGIELFIFFINL